MKIFFGVVLILAALFGLVAILGGVAFAAPPEMTQFDSIEEAAVHALQNAYATSHYYEVGGVITQIAKGKFAIGVPFTQWSGREVQIDYDPDRYHGKIVGDYHQHPCNSNNFVPGSFSGNDLHEYRVHHVEGFMLDTCTGEVHAFTPWVDKTPDGALSDGQPITIGRIVGKIPVDGRVTDTDLPVITGDDG